MERAKWRDVCCISTKERPQTFTRKTLSNMNSGDEAPSKLKLIGWHSDRGSIVPHDEVKTSRAISKGPGQPRYQGARVSTCSVVPWFGDVCSPREMQQGFKFLFISLNKAITKITTRVPCKDLSERQQEGTDQQNTGL